MRYSFSGRISKATLAAVPLLFLVASAPPRQKAAAGAGLLSAARFPGSDMGARVNAAIAALRGHCGTVYVPGGAYRISTPIIKPRCVVLEGAGGGIIASAAQGASDTGTTLIWTPSSGAAIAVGDSLGAPPYPAGGGLRNLTILGPGERSSAIAVWLGGDPAGTVVPANFFGAMQVVGNVSIARFANGVVFGSNAWVEAFYNLRLGYCRVGITSALGAHNTAENNRFFGGAIFNGGAPVVNRPGAQDNTIDPFFYGTSFDYNSLPVTGYFNCSGCHFETDGGGPFVVSGRATVTGGEALFGSAVGHDAAMFSGEGGPGGSWTVENLHVWSSHPVDYLLDKVAGAQLKITGVTLGHYVGAIVDSEGLDRSADLITANSLRGPQTIAGSLFIGPVAAAPATVGRNVGSEAIEFAGAWWSGGGSKRCLIRGQLKIGAGASPPSALEWAPSGCPDGTGVSFGARISAPAVQNACSGTSGAMHSGTVTIRDNCITGFRPVMLVEAAKGGVQGILSYTQSPGRLVVSSTSKSDTSTVSWVQN